MQDHERYKLQQTDLLHKREQEGIPSLTKTRGILFAKYSIEKQSYLYEAVEKHNSRNFVNALLVCNVRVILICDVG